MAPRGSHRGRAARRDAPSAGGAGELHHRKKALLTAAASGRLVPLEVIGSRRFKKHAQNEGSPPCCTQVAL